jgi:hypothetical protein
MGEEVESTAVRVVFSFRSLDVASRVVEVVVEGVATWFKLGIAVFLIVILSIAAVNLPGVVF